MKNTVRAWIENEVYEAVSRYEFDEFDEDEITRYLIGESVDGWDGTDDPDDPDNDFIKDRVISWIEEELEEYEERIEIRNEEYEEYLEEKNS